jgi:predicted site-specific integrase-resolvase
MLPKLADDWLTLDEALAELDVSLSTFERYRRTGLIAAVVHGGRIRVKPQWIADYRTRREDQAAKERAERERIAKAQATKAKTAKVAAKVKKAAKKATP